MSRTDLDKCPFCNRRPVILYGATAGTGQVTCLGCGASGPCEFDYDEPPRKVLKKLRTHWNKRA